MPEGNEHKIILDLCGGTGAWSKPYRDAGYDVRLVTLPERDVRAFVPPENVYGILAAPPCTMFSRARTTVRTPRDWRGAVDVVSSCLRVIGEAQYDRPFNLRFWALENPRGHLQRFIGRPAFKFQPYDFGDHYQKETWLWGFFNRPRKHPVTLSKLELHQSNRNSRPLPVVPGKRLTVADRRAITPPGFASAFFKANP